MDNILSAGLPGKKGIDSPVPGHADIILAPSIEVANTFSKTLNYLMHSSNAGIVMGAAAPIILPSRSATRRPSMPPWPWACCWPSKKIPQRPLTDAEHPRGIARGCSVFLSRFIPGLSRGCPALFRDRPRRFYSRTPLSTTTARA